MGRACAVKECQSGSAKDNRRRKNLNLRKPSFYKVPKNPGYRKQWIDALSIDLTEKMYVCELHFHCNDIQDSFINYLSNGERHVIPRGRKTRKLGAIPLPIVIDKKLKKKAQHKDRRDSEIVPPEPDKNEVLLPIKEEPQDFEDNINTSPDQINFEFVGLNIKLEEDIQEV